jgi:hypothetical protein
VRWGKIGEEGGEGYFGRCLNGDIEIIMSEKDIF